MRGINLRPQPSRPPPQFDPVVEAWLDSLPPPATKPSLKELRQWRLTNYHGLGRSVFVTCITLRAVSLAIAVSVTALTASAAVKRPVRAADRLVPCLVVCPIVALWNTAEFVAAYLVRDGGVPPNVHVVVDGVLFLGVAVGMGILLVDVICGVTDFASTFDSAVEEICSVCLLVILMVIHSFLLFFFICNYVENTRKTSRPVAAHSATPEHAHIATPWPDARHAADKAGALTVPAPLKLGQITTTVEMEELDPKLHHQGVAFGIPRPYKLANESSPAAVLDSSALAQAMSGLWDVDAGSYCQAKLPARYREAIDSEADQQASALARYM